MTSETNYTCLGLEEIEPSTEFVKGLAVFLIILMVATVGSLSTLFCLNKSSSSLLSSRDNVITYTYVIGSFAQLGWAADSLKDRRGFPCAIINNLFYIVIAFQIAPRILLTLQTYFKLKLNRQLAKFELISAVNLRGYNKFDDDRATELVLEDEEKPKSGKLQKLCGILSCGIFSAESRRKDAEKKTLIISKRIPGVTKIQELDEATLEQYPPQYFVFLASKKLAIQLQVLAIVIVLFASGITTADEMLCTSPCNLEFNLLTTVLLLVLLLVPPSLYFLYQVRNEPDPLGLVFEVQMTLLVGFILGVPTLLFMRLDPGNKEEDGKVRWALLWGFGSCLEVILSLGYPLYLSRKSNNFRKKHFNHVALSKVLESQAGRDQFKAFLIGELSVENYLFWQSGRRYKENFHLRSIEENVILRNYIVKIYVNEEAQFAVNVSGEAKNFLKAALQKEPEDNDFDLAVNDVLQNMQNDSFTRFRRTSEFNRLFSGEAGTL